MLPCLLATPALAQMQMDGSYGSYPMTRESSGTAWVPDSTPMEGIHTMQGDWMLMLHGNDTLVYDHQGGKRGEQQSFNQGMLMGTASHPLGDGTIGFRAMLSPEPAMGKSGYPLLLQTGETPNGRTPLIDRQHPHDLLMELATTYSHPLSDDSSAFLYLGYPGEPALGPTTFMHRVSAEANPSAPLTHHWLDSTHITYGVATTGYVYQNWKLEGSVFNGREPDQYRWNFDEPRFDSQSIRLSYNPTANWALQISHGWLNGPEQLEPTIDQQRSTASATYNLPFGPGNNWQTTLVWGRDNNHPGRALDAFLLESSATFADTHTVFTRLERVRKDELFTPLGTGLETDSPLAGNAYTVNAISLGYEYDVPIYDHVKMGLGGVGTVDLLPDAMDNAYGKLPASVMLFTRFKLD